MKWRCVGPFRGGRIVAVSGSYDDPSTFYFGAVAGGIWKTTDAGSYWTPISDGYLNTSSIGALAVAPSDSNVIYAGTGETTIRIDVTHGDGVYKSTDAGKSWDHIGLEDTRFIGKIRVHPDNPDIVWVAALGHAYGPNKERGVFKSVDGGANLEAGAVRQREGGRGRHHARRQPPHSLRDDLGSAPQVLADQQRRRGQQHLAQHRRRRHLGEHHRQPGTAKGNARQDRRLRLTGASGRVWALVEHTTEGGVYRSEDHGDTWIKVERQPKSAFPAPGTTSTSPPTRSTPIRSMSTISTSGKAPMAAPLLADSVPHGDCHDLWIDPKDNRRMIQANDGGANISLNGGYSFSSIFNQPTAQFYHIP